MESLRHYAAAFIESMRVQNYSEQTAETHQKNLGYFLNWAQERSVTKPNEVTRPILQRYQRYLFYYRQKNGKPLTLSSQHKRLVVLRQFFKWLVRGNYILYNPASELELPKLEHRLPRSVLTVTEAEGQAAFCV